MSRFYDVEVLSIDANPSPFASSYFARSSTALSRVVAEFAKALKSKGEKVKKSEQLEWLQGRATEVEPDRLLPIAADTFLALTRGVRGKKRLLASLGAGLQDPSVAHADLYDALEDEEDLIRPALYLSYNMCSFLRPKDFAPVREPEVVLDIRSRVLPEGAIPAMSFEFLRGWAVRHLRDHDQKANPWLEAYTLDGLQGHHPAGFRHVFVCGLEQRSKKRASARFIAPRAWIAHLEAGDAYESAA